MTLEERADARGRCFAREALACREQGGLPSPIRLTVRKPTEARKTVGDRVGAERIGDLAESSAVQDLERPSVVGPEHQKAARHRFRKDHPERLVEEAIRGMLPKSKLGDAMYRKLKVYARADHPHAAQKPSKLEVA